MIAAVTTALGDVIGWVGTIITAITGETGELNALLPLLAVGIAVTVIFLGAKVVRKFAWGV